jgi:hypothetical protein
MDNVNSIRPDDGTSLRALSEVRSAAQASLREDSRSNGKGQRDSEGVLRQTVNDRKATSPSEGGWRQNGRKCKRGKQGDLLGSTRCSWPQGPKSRPAGVRASVVARKRVTSVEPRDAGRWKGEIQNNGRQTNASARKGYAVAGAGQAQLTWRAPKVWPTSLCGAAPASRRDPTDRKAGCGKSARPVWREGWRESAIPTPIGSTLPVISRHPATPEPPTSVLHWRNTGGTPAILRHPSARMP